MNVQSRAGFRPHLGERWTKLSGSFERMGTETQLEKVEEGFDELFQRNKRQTILVQSVRLFLVVIRVQSFFRCHFFDLVHFEFFDITD